MQFSFSPSVFSRICQWHRIIGDTGQLLFLKCTREKAEINILLNGSLYGLWLPVKSIFMEAFTALNTSEIRSLSYLLFKTCLLKLQQVILQLDT